MQLKITGGGHAAKNNGINGDLLVVIEEIEHKEFKREGADLIYNKVVSISDAILGCDIEIPCFDGPYKTKIEPGTQSGTVLRLRGKGLPSVNGYGNGDLFVKVLVYIPKKISRDEKEIIEKLRDSENFEPSKSKEDKGFFDRLKNLF
jgi:molecular chaperone DnaJ